MNYGTFRSMTVLLGAAALWGTGCSDSGSAQIEDMRCEYMRSPVGIGLDMPPRFTWTYAGDEDFVQGKCRVRIASTKEALADSLAPGDVWTSPEIVSGNGFVECDAALALEPRTRYYWSATAWDEAGRIVCSPVDSFETAMADGGWTAKWITDRHDKNFAPSPMLRKSFIVKDGVREARLYMSAAAYGKMTVNGEPVTENKLEPGYTHYDKRNLYATYDVTKLLRPGENVVAAVLGNGFYNEIAPVATWDFEDARWRDRARMICELYIVYGDGTSEVIASDGSWKTATGPYLQNNIYSGDTYDARLEIPGWDRPGFDDRAWKPALEVAAPSPVLTAQTMPGIRPTREIKPVGVRSFGDTVYVFDFGENMSGLCRLKISGERGTKVEMQHGELLKDNGRVEMRNIDIYYDPMPGLGFQTDYYTLKGDGEETFTPDFNYHGFRWVEVRSDRPMKLDENSLTALCMHTAVEPVGEFRCSNDMLNEVWKATRRAYLANLMSIPTDCPQREKNGWTADAALAIDLALLNYDGILFYEKWFDDVADNIREDGRIAGIIPTSSWGYDDWIGPVWDASILIIPNAIYNYYGDKRTIEKIYPTVEKYLTYLKTREDSTGLVTYGIGDWVFYKTQTPTAYTSSCFYYLDYALMSRFAELTGRDAAPFREKAERIREAVNRIYFDSTAVSYANGSQAALAVALGLGIVPEGYEQRVADNLAKAIEEQRFPSRLRHARQQVRLAHADALRSRRRSLQDGLAEGLPLLGMVDRAGLHDAGRDLGPVARVPRRVGQPCFSGRHQRLDGQRHRGHQLRSRTARLPPHRVPSAFLRRARLGRGRVSLGQRSDPLALGTQGRPRRADGDRSGQLDRDGRSRRQDGRGRSRDARFQVLAPDAASLRTFIAFNR